MDGGELGALMRAYDRRTALLRSGQARTVEMWQEERGVTLKVVCSDGSLRVEWIARGDGDPADGDSPNGCYDRE